MNAAGGDVSDLQNAYKGAFLGSVWADDTLSFDNTSLPAFPIGMPGSSEYQLWFDTQSNLGLCIGSTILSALKAAGNITSHSYSWWWGQNGANENAQMDGSIVLGGYDKAKTSGAGYTRDLVPPDSGCLSGMRVTVSSLLLNFPNGTVSNWLGEDQISACLQPDFPALITMEISLYNKFERLTGTQNITFPQALGRAAGPLFPADNVYATCA